ncbi:MAG TPA: cysteine--tRNA ligase [Coxiellaceae bacterium]|nr:cysteine--tRNA ligase [Coxiellaceae bacterium]
MLTFYNSLTQQKEVFHPKPSGVIDLYVCGMTVYDYCHIGHGRIFVVYDALARYFRAKKFRVNYVRNITDIDDKIIKRANENKESYSILTERFIHAMHEDEKRLGCESPTQEPKATEFIEPMIEMIQALLQKGFAYIGKTGDIYYDVRKFRAYGKLSHRDIDELRSGARVEVNLDKHDPLDFVLWKLSEANEPSWSSPWGQGRPGWHIECSAMSSTLLKPPFDFHGGGVDLKFPHHENEIAQTEAVCECEVTRGWMHVGHVQVNAEKMSKSLGNFLTIREACDAHHPEAVRYFMLSAHYRSPLTYSEENLRLAEQALARLYTAIRGLVLQEESSDTYYDLAFDKALSDDFNTPEALAVLFQLAKAINVVKEQNEPKKAASLAVKLIRLGQMLGLLVSSPEEFLQGDQKNVQAIEALIQAREQARQTKDWKKADEIRAALTQWGVVVEDGPKGSTWRML